MKVSIKDIEEVITDINFMYGNTLIELDGAYGGYKVLYCKTYSDVFNTGFVSKKTLYGYLYGFQLGLQEGKAL